VDGDGGFGGDVDDGGFFFISVKVSWFGVTLLT
jgi:hypothetical protein